MKRYGLIHFTRKSDNAVRSIDAAFVQGFTVKPDGTNQVDLVGLEPIPIVEPVSALELQYLRLIFPGSKPE